MACFHVWCGFEGRHCDKCAPKAAGRAGGDVRYTLIQTLKAVGGIHNPEANASIIADAVIAALALPAPVVEGDVDKLRDTLRDLVSWFPEDGPTVYGPWIIKAGEYGADDAIAAARAALSEGRSHG